LQDRKGVWFFVGVLNAWWQFGTGRARPSGWTVFATARRISAAVSFACSYVRLLANVLPAVVDTGARPLMRVGALGVIGILGV
jgi:hypothetical protein